MSAVDADGTCRVLVPLAGSTNATETVRRRPPAVVGEYDSQLGVWRMQPGYTAPAWAASALADGGPAEGSSSSSSRPTLRPEARLALEDVWLDASDWLDGRSTCQLQLVAESPTAGAAEGRMQLQATELAYTCARGTRVALASKHRYQEASATVVHVTPDGGAVCCIDNTRSLR